SDGSLVFCCRQSVGTSSFGSGTFTRCRQSSFGHRTFLPALSNGTVHLLLQNGHSTGMTFSGGAFSWTGSSERADRAAASTSIGGGAVGGTVAGLGTTITCRHWAFLHVARLPARVSGSRYRCRQCGQLNSIAMS